ncbi:DNA polymerase gamma 1 [Coniosporium apollinis CBS 100218]|uniref:DNA-directed DNA polymerase n=1 Tax=Coniosporium apollinis (strain CBS 100218) TaxID=1168221 RepID=R7YQF9_CONA1|nr:DNA polymerase gamma 1 [Coniosporium apollinis CBS 100218]EON64054.1 DNA polymerase gamma 1 [Coniosporium apollinis CBS 100218]
MRVSRRARLIAQIPLRHTSSARNSSAPYGFLSRRCYAIDASSQEPEHRSNPQSLSIPSQARFNDIGVQQLSSTVHPQVFPGTATHPPQELIELSKDHLTRHDLLGKNQDSTPPVGFDIPGLQGASLDEHFYRLGMDAAEPWLSLAKKYARANAPPKPRKWLRRSGWTKYNRDGTSEAVDAPNESMLTFDTEVMWKETSFACMACAVSPDAWYAWISPWLLGESDSDRHLIPLGDPDQAKIVIGHNIGYDRARIAEEYDIKQSSTGFVDTMSLHVAVNGMCSRQRPTWVKRRKERELRDRIASSDEGADLSALLESGNLTSEEEELWIGRSSVNSLRDVAHFHCGITIDKAQREYFGELDRAGIRGKLEELLDYCAADVEITHRVYQKVFPLFVETCPHPVSFAALRHLSAEILPVNKTWDAYIANAEATYHKLSDAVQARLEALAAKALEIKDQPEKYTNDPWLSQLDWSGQEIRYLKPKKKGDPPKPAARQKKPGMPNWYKGLFVKNDGPMNLTVRTRIAPLLLRLAWDSYPLVWSDKHGWTYQVPIDQAFMYNDKGMSECDMSEEENPTLHDDTQHQYFKVPHKDGPMARCANPLAKGYLQHFEQGRLSSEYAYAKEALEMNASCSYWISARDRIMSQMVVYASETASATPSSSSVPDKDTGFILPQIIPMGTITRRAVENTWLTASNAKPNRVGSELKSMIQAPPGYCFVGADVDSQELWIASLVGDAQFQLHGGNAIGFMTLEGTKAAGTDMHSRTAQILGISRNDAKVFNYGRIYGAGLKFAATLLRQFNPSLTEAQTAETAAQLYQATKGKKSTRKALHDRPFWRGGTESLVFNRLEDFAEQERPRTPVLGAGITEALLRRFLNKGGFITSRINWAIQSSGVDYLHLLIVSMDYLVRRYNLSARLAITVHDEIRYLVKEEDKYRAAMALQVANLWTRAMFSQQMGIHDLPQSCAFFSAVDVDHVLRKEVDMDCVTPSHSTPIPPGESLDIVQLLDKGAAALLDPNIQPNREPELAKWTYEPRVPVMAAFSARDTDLGFLKAQITADDAELRDIIRNVRSGPQQTGEQQQSGQHSQKPLRRKGGKGKVEREETEPRRPFHYQQGVNLMPVDDAPFDRRKFFGDWERAKGALGWQAGHGVRSRPVSRV